MQSCNRESTKNIIIRYAIIVAAAVLFAFTAYLVATGYASPIDDAAMSKAYAMRTDIMTVFCIAVTHCGDSYTVTAVIALLLLIPRTRKVYGIAVAPAGILSVVLYKLVKTVFIRPRPEILLRLVTSAGYSFPSGHSMSVLVVYGMLIFLIRRNCAERRTKNVLSFAIGVLIVLIGLSRIYVGVHYPTDIIGGWSLGAVVLTASTLVYDRAISGKES